VPQTWVEPRCADNDARGMNLPRFGARARQSGVPDASDLQTQLESLFDSIWKAESMWRLEDRISSTLRCERPESSEARRGSKDAWSLSANETAPDHN
jgi:hypothetical protein